MNWPLFWGIALAFGVIIGNIMLIKHSAKMKMPSLKDLADPQAKPDNASQTDAAKQTQSKPVTPSPDQKPNSPD
ncbi:DUF2897 family protein [Alishewanella sp. SMS8]|uniref:DUF2897 family protein n=1 Tax=unclassified Alishewanella TaxID=2628974 RepID=UPI002740DF43|nr:DUF2897 family protein [Alishewanella sp. SMS8]MDP4944352.1 DUF2897 family protein [Alishewanella sp.]MDP5037264.1 DUF2897 family protein [Alishewanella sp.]MDP5185950.1 DUF2897 family protein [Alishewanella sp.]MDP5457808.1 DUF2897 family protein [Alishewanella sp. SMS8]